MEGAHFSGGDAHALALRAGAPPAPEPHRFDVAAVSARLAEPINLDDVRSRPVGGGKTAAYVPADRAFLNANDILGFCNWACEVKRQDIDYCVQDAERRWSVGVSTIMRVSVRDGERLLCYHEDVGYGSASRLPNIEAAVEMAKKGSVTDARKRCLRLFGESLGGGLSDADFQAFAKGELEKSRREAQRAAAAAAGGQRAGGGAASSSSSGGGFSATSTAMARPSMAAQGVGAGAAAAAAQQAAATAAAQRAAAASASVASAAATARPAGPPQTGPPPQAQQQMQPQQQHLAGGPEAMAGTKRAHGEAFPGAAGEAGAPTLAPALRPAPAAAVPAAPAPAAPAAPANDDDLDFPFDTQACEDIANAGMDDPVVAPAATAAVSTSIVGVGGSGSSGGAAAATARGPAMGPSPPQPGLPAAAPPSGPGAVVGGAPVHAGSVLHGSTNAGANHLLHGGAAGPHPGARPPLAPTPAPMPPVPQPHMAGQQHLHAAQQQHQQRPGTGMPGGAYPPYPPGAFPPKPVAGAPGGMSMPPMPPGHQRAL